jgi:hypothetical protein
MWLWVVPGTWTGGRTTFRNVADHHRDREAIHFPCRSHWPTPTRWSWRTSADPGSVGHLRNGPLQHGEEGDMSWSPTSPTPTLWGRNEQAVSFYRENFTVGNEPAVPAAISVRAEAEVEPALLDIVRSPVAVGCPREMEQGISNFPHHIRLPKQRTHKRQCHHSPSSHGQMLHPHGR